MKRVLWADRQIGDWYTSAIPSLMHDAIWAAERADHPDAPTDFASSHWGLVGPVAGWVTEAWLTLGKVDSVASVVSDAKYAAAADAGQIEVWRMDGMTPEIAKTTFDDYLAVYVPERYGELDLFGFAYRAVVKEITGLDVENPIEVPKEAVCSQGVTLWGQLAAEHRELDRESWLLIVDVRDCDPLYLRALVLAHQ